MACNVFGVPITTDYQNKVITQSDRAKKAMEMKNADGKDINARAFALSLEGRYVDSDHSVATMCMIYNATGDPIRLFKYHYWTGDIGETPLPVIIMNGQWGVFVHTKELGRPMSSAPTAAVAYQGNNKDGKQRHWLISWINNKASNYDPIRININKVYAEICDTTQYNSTYSWNRLTSYLNKGSSMSQKDEDGGMMFVSIGQGRCFYNGGYIDVTGSLLM